MATLAQRTAFYDRESYSDIVVQYRTVIFDIEVLAAIVFIEQLDRAQKRFDQVFSETK